LPYGWRHELGWGSVREINKFITLLSKLLPQDGQGEIIERKFMHKLTINTSNEDRTATSPKQNKISKKKQREEIRN
jgi:hypothetical protein